MKHIKTYQNHNESIRDFLKPKTKEEIEDGLKDLSVRKKLYLGCEYGRLDLVKHAVEQGFVGVVGYEPVFGIDPSINNNYAIELASNNGHYDIVNYLLKDKRVLQQFNRN